MTIDPSRKFGAQFDADTSHIFVGEINQTRDGLRDGMEDTTGMTIRAVAELVFQAYEGAMDVTYEDGIGYRIEVTKIARPLGGNRIGLEPDGTVRGFD